ncbi:probable histone acetyltransferase HAC-like 1, partial [Amborella trichopoda]|uniref:probable histone acetyltransferase HAC-like 1 n=1 Tax=Amborella trichopoda TaxID=13333 RepID=UPI0009BD3BF5
MRFRGPKMDNGMEHTTPGFVIVKDTATKMGSSLTFGHEIPGNKMDNGMEQTYEVKEGIPLISSGELSSQITCENRTELNMCKMEMKQEPAILSADCEAGTMHGKQKIQGASLLEFVTPEKITDHNNSLRQCVGLTNSKAEHCQAMESSANQSSCQMCGMVKLSFAPPDVYCNQCGLHVKRDATYYTTSTREKQYYFCRKCFHGACKRIEVERSKILKSSFDEKKHAGTLDEEWVQCDGCQSWNHQICALFNKRKNYSEEAEYICPKRYLKGVEGGERKPLPQSALCSAKDLPTTFLSDHLEHRLFE